MPGKSRVARLATGMALLLALAGAVLTGRMFWREATLPIYTMGTRPAERDIAVNTLTQGATVYVSGPDEFPLQPIWPALARAGRIGKTEGGSLTIYRPDGQTGDDFVYSSGDMMTDTVYRKEGAPPVALAALPIGEIRLARNISGTAERKTTHEAQIIGEAVAALTDPALEPAGFAPGDTAGHIGYVLLLSPRLPGLAYYADVRVEDGGRAYLRAKGPNESAWLPVGEAFARWARE